MELVYLWVEDYKNIQKQGFNFSPRFRCEYDEKENKLDIVDKDETGEFYPKNFFGENINVTAIVGENGSGKSSILEILKNKRQNIIKIFFDNENKKFTKMSDIEFYTKNEIKEIDKKDLISLFDSSFFPKLNNELYFVLGSTQRYTQFSSHSLANEDNENINLEFKTFLNAELILLNHLKDMPFIKYIKIIERNEDLIDESYQDNIVEVEEHEKIKEFLKESEDFNFYLEFLDKNKNVINLSIGEYRKKSLDIMFLRSVKENNIFLFDETENSIHPSWQQKYIYSLINILRNKKNIHIIITSHSPFILSDLPKENVIFLEKDERTGKCVNATEKMKDFNTFGANIHTLLSHGFFMKDGLMGEFAKDKIDLAIGYLNKPKLSKKEFEYCENIIPIIGEPIIKRQLQKMLDSKRLKKIDEIDKIYDEIEFLKHRIEILRKNQ